MPAPAAEITTLLHAWGDGDASAQDHLLPLIYDELRRLARRHLRDERADHTLNTTALVHEAYLRLVDVERVRWADRAHFLAMASRTMRRVLVDYAKARRAQKRGAGATRVPLDEHLLSDPQAETLLDLDDALTRLEARHDRAGQALALRLFGGLANDEIAAALGTSVATTERDVRFARAWLAREWRDRLPDDLLARP
jgi:RNA polymerase sigma-70 factor, ECF subfamily